MAVGLRNVRLPRPPLFWLDCFDFQRKYSALWLFDIADNLLSLVVMCSLDRLNLHDRENARLQIVMMLYSLHQARASSVPIIVSCVDSMR